MSTFNCNLLQNLLGCITCVVLSLLEPGPMVFRFLRQTAVFINLIHQIRRNIFLQLADIFSLVLRN